MANIVEKTCYGCRLSAVEDKLTCQIVVDSIDDAARIFRAMHDSEPYMILQLGKVYCYE